jgi:hypothetical protein
LRYLVAYDAIQEVSEPQDGYITVLSEFAYFNPATFFAVFAAIFSAATYYMRTMVPLRVVGIIANLFFIAYGYFDPAYFVLVLYLGILPINFYRLLEMRRLIEQVKQSISHRTYCTAAGQAHPERLPRPADLSEGLDTYNTKSKCARSERPSSRAAEKRDELPPPYSITSSARCWRNEGTWRLIASSEAQDKASCRLKLAHWRARGEFRHGSLSGVHFRDGSNASVSRCPR